MLCFANDANSGKVYESTLLQYQSDNPPCATLQLEQNWEGEGSWMAEVLRLC